MKHFKATIKEKTAKDGLVHFLYPEYYGDVTKEYLIKFWGLISPMFWNIKSKNTMTKEELIFTIDYNVKSMEFACADDNCFKAHFVDENGETFDFTASRQKVLEHTERFSAHPERYISNKGLCVAHFHRMAINWYKKTHLSKWAQELVNNN